MTLDNLSTCVEFTLEELIDIKTTIAELETTKRFVDNNVRMSLDDTIGLLEYIHNKIGISFEDQPESDGA